MFNFKLQLAGEKEQSYHVYRDEKRVYVINYYNGDFGKTFCIYKRFDQEWNDDEIKQLYSDFYLQFPDKERIKITRSVWYID